MRGPRDFKPGDIIRDFAHHFLQQLARVTDSSPYRQNRNVQLAIALKHVAVVFGVLLKRAIEFKARTHSSRGCVGAYVHIHVTLIDCRRIEDSRIEECLQVLSFAARHEHLSHIARIVKAEMPNAGIGLDAVEHRSSR